MAIERTLVLIKPDGRKRRLTGLAIDKLEATGLELVAAKIMRVTRKLAEQHYQEHAGKPFFEAIVRYLVGEVHDIP
nr:nucleoside-diphosphate kinase [Elusimicrobiales bacterium]